jgi:hypothetical protein
MLRIVSEKDINYEPSMASVLALVPYCAHSVRLL